MDVNKEYYASPYYFYIKTRNYGGSLYFNLSKTLSESRKNDEKIDFDLKDLEKVKNIVNKIISTKKIKTLSQLKDILNSQINSKGEIGELVDADGAFLGSRIPKLNRVNMSNRTMDQVILNRMTNNPVTRGYRRYYGESVNNTEDVVSETNLKDAFGYKETKNKNGKETFNFFVNKMDMDPIEAIERTRQFGKDPSGKQTKKAPKKIRKQKGFIDRMTLAEKNLEENAVKMIEDIIMNSKNSDYEISEKENPIKNILKKNIKSLKMMAEKNGISINELIKMFKGE